MRQDQLEKKLKIYTYIILGLLAILCVRLAVVQIFYTEDYQTKARENRIRMVAIKAPRGEIYDRNGSVLAANELVYTVSLTYVETENQDEVIQSLSKMMTPYYPQVTPEFIKKKVKQQEFRLFEPVVVMRDIPWELVVKIEENRNILPGVSVTTEPLRVYPGGTLAGHVMGYVHSINADELAENDDGRYNINSLIGKSGVEKQYEKFLRGSEGARRVEVDATGRPLGELVTLEPTTGNNLTLTIDKKLQKVMEASTENIIRDIQRGRPKAKVASAVVLDVKTGEVLAMCSKPDIDPNDFKGNISGDKAQYYFPQGDYNPLKPGAATNRAIQTTYPPGSTFKPITGMAGLEAGMSPQGDYVNCAGKYWIAPYIGCTGVHGNLNYYSGMAKSCNVYFQEMGRRAGKDNIIKVAKDFGLGERTGIDLPYENKGLVPTPEWKKEINGLLIDRKYDAKRKELEEKYRTLLANADSEQERERLRTKKENEKQDLEARYKIEYNFDTKWQAFDTFNMSIGQGSNNYTVIGLANYAATIANGGDLMRPHVVKQITDSQGKVVKKYHPQLNHHTTTSKRTIAETRRAMAAVTDPGGTASFLFSNFPSDIKVAAKTGTAETGRAGDIASKEFHGVFIAFAPANDPQIAFAGVVEYGRYGSESAGWIAKAVFEQYFGIMDHYSEIEAREKELKKQEKGKVVER